VFFKFKIKISEFDVVCRMIKLKLENTKMTIQNSVVGGCSNCVLKILMQQCILNGSIMWIEKNA